MIVDLEWPEGDEPARGAGSGVAAALWAIARALHVMAAAERQDPDNLLTAEELGELFQLSPRTLKDQAAAGLIAHHRFGKHYRFSRSDIAEILRLSGQAVQETRQIRRVA